jgi:hypothetical protein
VKLLMLNSPVLHGSQMIVTIVVRGAFSLVKLYVFDCDILIFDFDDVFFVLVDGRE